MAYVTVTGVTDTTASIEITGLDIYYFQKRLTFYCGEISYSVWDTVTFTVPESGKYSYTYTGLSPNTSYIFAVYIESMQGGTYIYEDEVDGSFATSGGGGGGEPRFIAYATNNNTDIYVNAYDMWTVDYDYIDYEISSGSYTDSYRVSSGSHTFEGVPSGTYTVEAWYIYNNRSYRIYSSEDESYITVVIGGGGGGWQLVSEDKGIVYSSASYPIYDGLTASRLYSYSIAFNTSGTYTFSSTGGADLIGWLSGWDQSTWGNNSSGYPDRYVPDDYLVRDDESGSGHNFQFEWTCTAGQVYYLWFREFYGDGYSGSDITITISQSVSPTSWHYEEVNGYVDLSSQEIKNIALSSYSGQYFGVSFANGGTATISVPSGANINLFVTDGNYSYDTADGYPLTYEGGKAVNRLTHSINVTAHSIYYVWVKGSTSSITGNIDVTIVPASAQTWHYTLDTSSIMNPSSTVTRSYTLTAGYGYYLAVRFSTSGSAVFYSEGSNIDDIAYLTASDSGYNPDNGVPYDLVDNDHSYDDDSGTGNNFRLQWNVTAGTTYYLWFRMYHTSGSGSITLYVVPPSQQTGGYVYIYTGSSWVRAKPYIYTGSAWVSATPYIYDGSTWKPTT